MVYGSITLHLTDVSGNYLIFFFESLLSHYASTRLTNTENTKTERKVT